MLWVAQVTGFYQLAHWIWQKRGWFASLQPPFNPAVGFLFTFTFQKLLLLLSAARVRGCMLDFTVGVSCMLPRGSDTFAPASRQVRGAERSDVSQLSTVAMRQWMIRLERTVVCWGTAGVLLTWGAINLGAEQLRNSSTCVFDEPLIAEPRCFWVRMCWALF